MSSNLSLALFASATARFATARSSRSAGRRSRPTMTSAILCAHASTPSSPATSARPRRSSRSTCESRTRRPTDDERRAPQARAARPERGRGDRARLLPDPVVEVDVRERALEALVALPGRVRQRDRTARRLPGDLTLRRRVARDERRRPPGPPPERDRLAAPEPPVRSDLRPEPPRLHARGARLERWRDQALRGDGLPRPWGAARLLHRQPRGRLDHVEGPGPGTGHALILAIETSCDETAAAVVSDDGAILSNVVSSQAHLHARFGGVVPEVASRHHLELVLPVVREALGDGGLDEIDRVAVTQGPGLIGALLVGLSAAKALAWGKGLPLVPVDHLQGHVASLYLARDPIEPPFLCLLASGGHTPLLDLQEPGSFTVLGRSLDDAAGEAFDKGARLLGLGYPGGAEIDRLAREGDPAAFDFPVARVPGLDFSFSGVKTALLYATRAADVEERKADLAASYQRAIVRALVQGTKEAAERIGAQKIAIVGGVAANSELRASLPEAVAPPLALCTDNAAMVASAARYAEAVPSPRYLALDAYAQSL